MRHRAGGLGQPERGSLMGARPLSEGLSLTPAHPLTLPAGVDASALAIAIANAHGYAMKVAVLVRKMDMKQLYALGVEALGRLESSGLITRKEKTELTKVFTVVRMSDNLQNHLSAIQNAAKALEDCGLFARLLIDIALTSFGRVQRDAAVTDGPAARTPHDAQTRMNSRATKVAAWLADVAAGAVAGGVAGAATTPSGPDSVAAALVVGSMAAAAASGAVLV